MKSLQIITTDEADGSSAAEQLWMRLAHAARKAELSVEAIVASEAMQNPAVLHLLEAGTRVKTRWALPGKPGTQSIAYRAWMRLLARYPLVSQASFPADFRLVNAGALVELGLEPWYSLCVQTAGPYGLLVHANPEFRSFPRRIRQRLVRVLGSATKVFLVSERMRETIERQLRVSLSHAEIVRNPVNLSHYGQEPWPGTSSSSATLRLAIVARLNVEIKGHLRLLSVLSESRWRDRDWQLGIFGAGPDAAQIEEAVAFYELDDRVFLKGFIEDVRSGIWADYHALLMPSLYEGMPLTLVEAMLCARPAVCSDVGGIAELLQDGRNGFLSASPSPKQFSVALERLWQSRGELELIGRRAHADAMAFVPADPGQCFLQSIQSATGSFGGHS